LTNEHSRLAERKAQLESEISLNKENIEIAEEALEYHTLELENAQEGLAHEENWGAQQSNLYDEQTNYRYITLHYPIEPPNLSSFPESKSTSPSTCRQLPSSSAAEGSDCIEKTLFIA
jgi:hypothetical protein